MSVDVRTRPARECRKPTSSRLTRNRHGHRHLRSAAVVSGSPLAKTFCFPVPKADQDGIPASQHASLLGVLPHQGLERVASPVLAVQRELRDRVEISNLHHPSTRDDDQYHTCLDVERASPIAQVPVHGLPDIFVGRTRRTADERR
jgi:hypothetical protein